MKKMIQKIQTMPNFRKLSGVSNEEIADAEKKLGVKFANDYRIYLEELGVASFSGHELTGICNFPRLNVVNVTNEERAYNPNIPKDLYVIEQANIDGIVIWQSSSGNIYQSYPENKIIKIAGSLEEYLIK